MRVHMQAHWHKIGAGGACSARVAAAACGHARRMRTPSTHVATHDAHAHCHAPRLRMHTATHKACARTHVHAHARPCTTPAHARTCMHMSTHSARRAALTRRAADSASTSTLPCSSNAKGVLYAANTRFEDDSCESSSICSCWKLRGSRPRKPARSTLGMPSAGPCAQLHARHVKSERRRACLAGATQPEVPNSAKRASAPTRLDSLPQATRSHAGARAYSQTHRPLRALADAAQARRKVRDAAVVK
eukprot:352902-Chlamydomonas_euryale.AAC.3